jgi:alkylation response protein AidB-like acyl-CoA dehydrogenase
MCGPVISDFGTDEQRGRWLPGIASGRAKMAFAVTEANAGSNSTNLATAAAPD